MSDKKKPFFHYRNAFKSDHLAAADVEELVENNGKAILTLKSVEYQLNRKVAGKTKDVCLVGFFKEKDTKPMIINATNSKILESFIGSTDLNNAWDKLDLRIELYVNENVKLSGKIVSGIRIKTRQPEKLEKVEVIKKAKKIPSPTEFAKIKKAIKKGSHKKEEVELTYKFTPEQELELNE
jgi:hypothetical protein|tara:strand:+ start:226 stop:768 length:543 start_codon:yes stop_codon:yes gene_type:complete